MECLCGSGKLKVDCHRNMTSSDIRKTTKRSFGKIGSSKGFETNYKSGNFKKSSYTGLMRLVIAHTPAGFILYPLMITTKNKALRPLTIDGHFQIRQPGSHKTNVLTIECMLTPIHFATIVFNAAHLQQNREYLGELYVECMINTVGKPFDSVFALEADTKKKRIALYHHTNEDAYSKITQSQKLKGSKWSIQGTNELAIDHIYLTDIPKIEDYQDLWDIGMCDKGTEMNIITDYNEIEHINVYRDNPLNRPSVLKVWIPWQLISANHLILHNKGAHTEASMFGSYSWWELFMPSIYRIPIKKGGFLNLGTIAKKKEFLIIKNDNFIHNPGFIGALGSDIHSLRRIWSEKNVDRPGDPYPADTGNIDPEWVNTWNQNLTSLTTKVFSRMLPSASDTKLIKG